MLQVNTVILNRAYCNIYQSVCKTLNYCCCSSILYTKYIPYTISDGFEVFSIYCNSSSLLSFQSPHSVSPSYQEQTQQLAGPTPSPALFFSREYSLGFQLYSGGGQMAALLLVETSLWAVHHPITSPSTHYDSPIMDSTPAWPLLGILLAHHQLRLRLQVIDSYIKAEHSILVKCTT